MPIVCAKCRTEINATNTMGGRSNRNPMCGKCYLKHKAQQRKKIQRLV